MSTRCTAHAQQQVRNLVIPIYLIDYAATEDKDASQSKAAGLKCLILRLTH